MYVFKLILLFSILLSLVFSFSNDPFKIELPIVYSQDGETFTKCQDVIKLLMERFRNIMPTGSKVWGIPPLEPFERDKIFVNGSNRDLGNITGYITNLKVEQLSTFIVTDVKCKLFAVRPKFYLNITIPFVNITGNYDLSGYAIDIVPMYGNGPFSINITNLYAGFIVTSNYISTQWKISNLNIYLAIDDSQVYFYNLLDGGEYEDLFNRMFTAIGPLAVEDLWPPVEPFISEILVEIVNEKLALWNRFFFL